jgi:adenosylhomocysteinase
MTIQTAVLIETLVALGAEVRWASCNIFSTQDHAAAAIAEPAFRSSPIKGETLEEYWDYTDRHLPLAERRNRQHDPRRWRRRHHVPALGEKAEAGHPSVLDNPKREEESFLFADHQEAHGARPGWFAKAKAAIKGVSEETTTGVSCACINWRRRASCPSRRSTSTTRVTKSKFDNKYGCRESPGGRDPPRHRRDDGRQEVAVVCGYGDVGKGSAQSLRNAGARVLVTEIDPICALQAAMDGFEVSRWKT